MQFCFEFKIGEKYYCKVFGITQKCKWFIVWNIGSNFTISFIIHFLASMRSIDIVISTRLAIWKITTGEWNKRYIIRIHKYMSAVTDAYLPTARFFFFFVSCHGCISADCSIFFLNHQYFRIVLISVFNRRNLLLNRAMITTQKCLSKTRDADMLKCQQVPIYLPKIWNYYYYIYRFSNFWWHKI